MLKNLAILLGIFLFLVIVATAYAQTQITDCPDKCTNGTLYQKGTLDPKTKLCVYGIQEPCKYGCENKIPSCKQFPDTPPAPNTTDYSDTIWNMVKTILDSQNGTLNTDIINQTFNTVSTMSQKGSISIHGTEYQVDDNATVFLQLLNATNQPINSALCYLTLYYPNKTIFLNNANMIYLLSSAGLYYYDVVVPNTIGVYMLSVSCDFSYNLTYINSSKDSYVVSSLPTTNYGNETVIVVGTALSGVSNLTSYIQFSNLTLNGNVTSAYLFLYKAGGIGSNLTVNLYRVTSDWNESNITWNNQPTVNGYKYDSKVMNSIGWYSWNITSLLMGWLNGTYTNYGMYLNFTSPALGTWNFSSFSSREYGGGYVPMILVMYDSTEFISEIRGSGELHVSNSLSNLSANINQTQLNNILSAIASINQTLNTTIQNYLITINGTTFQINQSLYNDYLSLLTAINSINATANQSLNYLIAINGTVFQINQSQNTYFQQILALLNSINYTLNTTLEYKLDLINGTVFQINQSQLAYYLNLLGSINSINATLNSSIIQYLVEINGTTHNISYNEFNHYLSLLEAINSVNFTTNTTLENKIDYLNNTVIPLLLELNMTGNTTLTLITEINQSLFNDFLSIWNFLSSINVTINTTMENKLDLINATVFQISDTLGNLNLTVNLASLFDAMASINGTINSTVLNELLLINSNILNHNSSEYQHFLDLFVILKDINYTTNTTLEYKLDLINYTTWNSWVMLQNLTLGNVSVFANINWSEGVPYIWNGTDPTIINHDLLALSNQGIQLVTESYLCLNNLTLQTTMNVTNCIGGVCDTYNRTMTKVCEWGCSNNQCLPAPQFQYFYALGFILFLAAVVYAGWRATSK